MILRRQDETVTLSCHYSSMIILALGVILLDYSYQALFNPCEALLSDLVSNVPEWEQTRGFTVYSASISLGCILGYLIVSIDWSSAGEGCGCLLKDFCRYCCIGFVCQIALFLSCLPLCVFLLKSIILSSTQSCVVFRVSSWVSGADGVLCDLCAVPAVLVPDAVLCPGEAVHAVPRP